MEHYISVPNQILYSILGANSHTEITVKNDMIIDKRKSHCATCPHYVANKCTGSYCDACTTKVETAKKQYFNEAHSLGYTFDRSLNSNAVKLLLYLFTLNPDKKRYDESYVGMIGGFNIDVAAHTIDCSTLTIIRCLEALRTHRYIDYFQNDFNAHIYSVMIRDYNHKPNRKKKGMYLGFTKISLLTLQELYSVKSIIALRIKLRSLIVMEKTNSNKILKTFSEIRHYLPTYARRGSILSALQNDMDNIFFIKETRKDIVLEINTMFRAEADYHKKYLEYQDILKRFLSDMDDYIHDRYYYSMALPTFKPMEDYDSCFRLIKSSVVHSFPPAVINIVNFVDQLTRKSLYFGIDVIKTSLIQFLNSYGSDFWSIDDIRTGNYRTDKLLPLISKIAQNIINNVSAIA